MENSNKTELPKKKQIKSSCGMDLLVLLDILIRNVFFFLLAVLLYYLIVRKGEMPDTFLGMNMKHVSEFIKGKRSLGDLLGMY